ncbi:MAG TPA: molybdopterin-dependent oxidoreductase, partial [Paracoccaceae bacterium]
AFWQSPAIPEAPGLKAVEMFDAVADGRIRALWIICTNPAVSMPDADRVAAAIAGCDFVVVSDMIENTDTTRLAHVLLPATGWAEKDGTVTNSERRISRQRRVLPAPGQARDDWRILADVAARMGWGQAFGWADAAAVFAEYAALSGLAGQLGSDFDISALAGITPDEYEALAPFTWPRSAKRQGGRFFADGRFHTPSGKARMLPITPRAPVAALDPDHPFRLNTGRARDHWHTMTRTGLSPRLSQHLAEPYLEIHPADAGALGLAPASLAQLSSPQGSAVLRVLITDRTRRGAVFAPIHWTGETAPSGRIDALVASVVDPVSGQPESKAAAVAIAPYAARWYGFAVSATAFRPDCGYWAAAPLRQGMRAELAGTETPDDWEAYARTLFALPAGAEALVMADRTRGMVRLAFALNGKVIAALFVAPDPVALARGHLASLLGAAPDATTLAGRPGADRPDPGAIVCSCFDVGVNQIVAAITGQGLITVEALGTALRAGTNCGSCRPELRGLIG